MLQDPHDPTWYVEHWLDNDPETQAAVRGHVEMLLAETGSIGQTADNLKGWAEGWMKDTVRRTSEAQIRQQFSEIGLDPRILPYHLNLEPGANLATDLLGWAFGHVDWIHVVEHLKEQS